MNAFLGSLRADLFGRRLRPLLALLALALVGAIVYAVLAGSSRSSSPASNASTPAARGGVTVSPAKTEATEAIAETTNGAGAQTGGATRNPFTPLPTPKAKASSSSSSSSSGSSSGAAASPSSGATSGSGSSAGSKSTSTAGSSPGSATAPAAGSSPSKPKPKKQSQRAYEVSILFGTAAPGTAPASAQLTPLQRLTLQQPLPSAQQPLVVFGGVAAGGKSATFTLVGEAILRGDGACRPSTSQCQAIDLRKGQTEELEYAPPGGAATNYLLQVLDINAVKAHGARARASIADVARVLVVDSEPQGLSASK